MRIQYEDEYGNLLFSGNTEYPPGISDSVILSEEVYTVKGREFYPTDNLVAIILTQSIIKTTQKDTTASSINEIRNAMSAIDKRQETADKKARLLSEQLVSIRSTIKHNINKTKKE